MIKNLPSAEQFHAEACNCLNLAWHIVITLCQQLEGFPVEDDADKELVQEHVSKSQYILRNAVTLIQQAQEFALKGKICAVSPYLLISGSPSNWPAEAWKEDVDFSRFRSVNASDLPLVHDAVCAAKLSGKAKDQFTKIRELRNSVMHGVPGALLHLSDIVKLVVNTHSSFIDGALPWLRERRRHLEDDEQSALYSNDYAVNQVCGELHSVAAALPSKLIKGLFGIDFDRDVFACPHCMADGKDWHEYPGTGNIIELDGKQVLDCVICGRQLEVTVGVCDTCGELLFAQDPDGDLACLCCHRGQPA